MMQESSANVRIEAYLQEVVIFKYIYKTKTSSLLSDKFDNYQDIKNKKF